MRLKLTSNLAGNLFRKISLKHFTLLNLYCSNF